MLYLNILEMVQEIQEGFYLTLTSVVFECSFLYDIYFFIRFNFNKCCIWIQKTWQANAIPWRFNFNKCCIWIQQGIPMGQVNQLFNFNKCCIWIIPDSYSRQQMILFNFNKCCIWMCTCESLSSALLQFNFNKCCIWMKIEGFAGGGNLNLTLTSVVFEFFSISLRF